jgi:hypothetical protein
MLTALLARVPFLRDLTRSHRNRNDRLKSVSDERRQRWNQVIAEHQNPVAPNKGTSTGTAAVTGSSPE